MASFSDPSWGTIEGPDFSIEVNVGKDEQVRSIALHVRGGDDAAGVVADILERLGLRGLDPQSDTGIFDRSSAVESLKRWRAFRDKAVASATAQSNESTSAAAPPSGDKKKREVHPDLSALFKALASLGKKLLVEVGQFTPVGASMGEDGKISITHPSTGEEGGNPQELIDLLTNVYRQEAGTGKIRAAGICRPVIISVAGQTEKKRAISVALEHASGQSLLVYIPYRIEYEPQVRGRMTPQFFVQDSGQ